MPAKLEELTTVDLGRCAYADAYTRQLAIHERVLAGQAGPTLLLVEHDPVITVSQRRQADQNILADARTLAALGIDVQRTNRGGDVTYHGPGQLVVYPILSLASLQFNVGRYIRFLENIAIDVATGFGIQARRIDGCTGVWAPHCDKPDQVGKLAAIGVRVKRNVTLHGLALNVHTDLSHFKTIIPCGLVNRHVTSFRELLGANAPEMIQVKAVLLQEFERQYRAARADATCG